MLISEHACRKLSPSTLFCLHQTWLQHNQIEFVMHLLFFRYKISLEYCLKVSGYIIGKCGIMEFEHSIPYSTIIVLVLLCLNLTSPPIIFCSVWPLTQTPECCFLMVNIFLSELLKDFLVSWFLLTFECMSGGELWSIQPNFSWNCLSLLRLTCFIYSIWWLDCDLYLNIVKTKRWIINYNLL